MRGSKSSFKNAPPLRRRGTSRDRTKSGRSCSTPGSYWKTLKKERAGSESEEVMKIETKVVHAGDRKKNPDPPGSFVPSSTPIYTATTYLYEDTAKLDRVLGRDEPGFCYGRYDNPTRTGLEELLTELEAGHSAQVCSSGMMALHVALLAALTDRRKSVLAANALYGATTTLLTQVLEPMGVSVDFVDVCDVAALAKRSKKRNRAVS